VVAYLYYIGRSLSPPYPRDVLAVPVFNTVCLLSSSATVAFAVRGLARGDVRRAGAWLLATVLLGGEFLVGTLVEWYRLIVHEGLTIGTNLFGSTFYALVGFHAGHVTVGLGILALCLGFAWSGALRPVHAERVEMVAWYWHFVDGVWVVVLTTVYIIGR
jgi:cytochrome c oxidase subunit 3/cytochrome o ubiquinol oxidase subunit 3